LAVCDAETIRFRNVSLALSVENREAIRSFVMARDPGDHFNRDVREQQRGFRKFVGGAGGMRLATVTLLAILTVGVLGILAYISSDRTTIVSSPPPITTGQQDQSTIPSPRDTETRR
jgi:hypothetical protein